MPLNILRSFRSRILALVLGLVILVLTATMGIIAFQARAEVERELAVQLRTAEGTARESLEFRGNQLASAVDVLTSDFGFREAVSTADGPTLLSAIENHRSRIKADMVILLDPEGHVLASTHGTVSPGTMADLSEIISNDSEGEILQLYRLIDGHPYQLVLAPVLAPEPIGWTAMGFALDDGVAGDMSRLLGVDVSFVAGPASGKPYIASSLSAADRAGLSAIERQPAATPFMIGTAGDKRLTLMHPIRSGNGRLILVLQRSLVAALRPYMEVRDSIIVVGALILTFASALAVLLARSATKPVDELKRAAERFEAGDYSLAVPAAGTTELHGLASALNAMRGAVADREATIRHQVDHDPLTGLPTRSRITAALDDKLQQARAARPVAVCLVEIQQFQSIIGSFGHAVGDEVLSEVARRLSGFQEKHYAIGYMGADRFAVLMDGVDGEEARGSAERMIERLRDTFDYSGVSFQLECRIGVVASPLDGNRAAELLRRSDLALYRANETGAGVGIYRTGDDDNHRQRLTILGELRRAIASDELELHYQPKVDAGNGAVVGCEALVRWHHPQKGFIPPGDFIPHAEQSGAIRALTLWVLAAALRDLKGWQDRGVAIDVSINVSAVDLTAPDFADNVARLVAKSGANAGRMVLEITESGAMKDLPATLRMMEHLRVLGVRFSIDDFGTGYSSLAHLKRLPVDEVKIDRSFVQELESHLDDDVVVRSTINLGHALHLKVVAEGVETAASCDALRRLGCDLIQGYFVSKPLPLTKFNEWMSSRPRVRAAGATALSLENDQQILGVNL